VTCRITRRRGPEPVGIAGGDAAAVDVDLVADIDTKYRNPPIRSSSGV